MEYAEYIIVVLAALLVYLLSCIRILFEYQRGVVFRLGRVRRSPKGPGLLLIFWPFDRMVRVSLRIVAQEVPAQDIITHDNVSVRVTAVVYFQVVDPLKAILEVEAYEFATSQLSQTTLRSVLGQADMDELLSARDTINHRLQETIDQHSEPWGVKVALVELKQVDLPEHMQRSMAKQAESERERRAKVIHAEGELQAASHLRDAAETIKNHPMALQMRFLQALVEVGSENNTTIVFPVPIDLLSPFLQNTDTSSGASDPPALSPRKES